MTLIFMRFPKSRQATRKVIQYATRSCGSRKIPRSRSGHYIPLLLTGGGKGMYRAGTMAYFAENGIHPLCTELSSGIGPNRAAQTDSVAPCRHHIWGFHTRESGGFETCSRSVPR